MTTAALWTKHRPLAKRMAYGYFIPGSEPQDVEQEALIGLWIAARDFNGYGKFEAWARMVIARRLIDCIQAANTGRALVLTESMRRIVSDEGGTFDVGEALPHLHQVSDRCEETEEVRELLVHIGHLPEFQRRCVLGIASGLAYHEIDGNIKRVDNALKRARDTLRAAA